jgi:hypothetical protein
MLSRRDWSEKQQSQGKGRKPKGSLMLPKAKSQVNHAMPRTSICAILSWVLVFPDTSGITTPLVTIAEGTTSPLNCFFFFLQ